MKINPDHIINEELARKYQSGDKDALKELIRRFNAQLTAKIYYHTKNRDSAKDIAQECWYVIINNLADIKFQIGFEAWALNIARNKSIDWIRAQQRERKGISEVISENENFISEEAEEMLEFQILEMRACMSLLPQAQKIILELFYKENLSLTEISEVLGISKGTVKSRLFTAREHLKKLIH